MSRHQNHLTHNTSVLLGLYSKIALRLFPSACKMVGGYALIDRMIYLEKYYDLFG